MVQVWIGGPRGGELVDEADAVVSANDRSLLVGEGVFETLKAVDGQPFALTRHLARLTRSAGAFALPAPDAGRVRSAVAQVLESARPLPLGRLRITYSAGTNGEPVLMVTLHPIDPWPQTTTVVTVPWVRNERSPLAGIKSTSYGDSVIAARYAAAHGASEALLANSVGDLCEGTSTNVFVVVDGRLLTPPVASGCLPGITRALLLEWTQAREQPLPYDVLDRADEVFVTSSTRDVQPVVAIDDRALPAARPVTTAVQHVFAERAGEAIDP